MPWPWREVFSVEVRDDTESSGEVAVEVHGDGFLYHQVRVMAAVVVEVGAGRTSVEEVRAWLEQPPPAPRRVADVPCAPPHGLSLREVLYDPPLVF